MADITVAGIEVNNWIATTDAPKLRAYYTKPFTAADGDVVEWGNKDGAGVAYKEVPTTLLTGTVTIPSFTIVSTRDGIDYKLSRVSFYWFDSNGAYIKPFGEYTNLMVNESDTSVTFADLKLFNTGSPNLPSDSYYNKSEVLRLIAAVQSEIVSAAPASATYWVSEANEDLTSEVNLGLLTTGLLKVSVSGAVATPMTATAETDYVSPSGVGTLSNKTLSVPIINVGSDAIGDTYYRNSGGMFTRRGIGTSGQVLTVSGGLPVWSTPSSGFADPMTTIGDVIIRDGTNTTARLGIGSSNQVLTVSGGVPTWANPASGFSDPMTTRGDTIIRNGSNTTARLAVGAANRYLGSDGTDIAYSQVSLSAGVTGALPIANGGTGSATRNFVQITGAESVAGTKTWTSNSVFIAATVNEPAWGAAGLTTSMFQGADAVADSASGGVGGNPSLALQTTRTGGLLGNSSIAYGFAVYSTSKDDAYGVYSIVRSTPNLNTLTGTLNITAGRSYVIGTPSNVGGSMNVNLYGHWIQGERGTVGTRAVGAQIDVNNSVADATVSFANIDTTFNIATNFGSGGHNTGIMYSQGATSTSAYAGWYVDSNAVCQRILDFTAATVTLQGTWTASAATTVAGSGGHADKELVAGDIVSVNGTLCTVASAIANTITLTATFGGTPASGLTITKKTQPAWFANNTYLWWNNAAASARYRFGGLGTDDRFALDPDARGVTFGSYTSYGINALGAPTDTLTSGWRMVLYQGGSGANYGFGVEGGSLWCMSPAGYKVYVSSSSAAVLGMTISSTGIVSFLTTTVSDSGGKILSAALNTVAATQGGTGQSSYAVGDLLYASTTTALSKLADVATGSILVSGGVSTAPAWSSSPTIDGNITLSGLGRRLIANLSDASIPNRFAIQSSTGNGVMSVLPASGSTTTAIRAFSNDTPANTTFVGLLSSTTGVVFESGVLGAPAAAVPMFFRINNVDYMGLTITGIFNTFKGADVASAGTITPTGNLFHVTGTTSITSVSGTGITAGTQITIIFDGVLTFTDGSNLKLAGNFVTTADDTITLKFDGTSWFELSRSVN